MSRRRADRIKDFLSIATAVVVVLFARSSLADHYHVPSGSMLPSLHEGDHIAVDKSAYGLRVPLTDLRIAEFDTPHRGDVIVFPSPETGDVLVKRVIAVGGDVVTVRAGRVAIEGKPAAIHQALDGLVEDLYGVRHGVRLEDGGPDFGPVRVPDHYLLVLGDNRGNSRDGRFFGWVPVGTVRGRVIGVFYRHGALTWTTP